MRRRLRHASHPLSLARQSPAYKQLLHAAVSFLVCAGEEHEARIDLGLLLAQVALLLRLLRLPDRVSHSHLHRPLLLEPFPLPSCGAVLTVEHLVHFVIVIVH